MISYFFKDLRVFSGTAILLGSLFVFIFLSSNFSFLKKIDCYELNALFDDVSGLFKGSEVLLFGVKVGEITEISLQGLSRVEVKMCISNSVKFPTDSVALISAKNILSGTKYVSIDIGGEEEKLSPGSAFQMTRSGLDIEKILRSFISSRLESK